MKARGSLENASLRKFCTYGDMSPVSDTGFPSGRGKATQPPLVPMEVQDEGFTPSKFPSLAYRSFP